MVKGGSLSGKEMQLVVFHLQEEDFGVDIRQVKEVLKLSQVTHLPHTAEDIEGVINLRGEVIPVINLRKRFGIPGEQQGHEGQWVIIVVIEGTQVGLTVDSVAEVIRLPLEAIERPSSTIAGTKSQFLEGVGKYNDRLLIILKLETILTTEERISLSDLHDWSEDD